MRDTSSAARWDLNNDNAMAEAVRQARIPLCITDPNTADNPIVFANTAFFDLTGYCEAEVIGRNCRFLQGPDTTAQSVAKVRRAIGEQNVETVEIINYRKDGSRFVNSLQIGPIRDREGQLVFFFGSQLDVTAQRAAETRSRKLADDELVHRLRNIVNVMNVIIRMTAREGLDASAMASVVVERLRTLSDAHFQTINRPDGQRLSLSDLATSILLAYAPKGAAQFELDGPAFLIPGPLISCIALTLHELATNSVKHGSLGAREGKVHLRWSVEEADGGARLGFVWEETGGPKVVRPERRSGSKLLGDLIAAIGGSIELRWREEGLIVEASFPV